ncbi:immunoglobulin domain-containing protein, partial [Flavobacterium akiainvivens]
MIKRLLLIISFLAFYSNAFSSESASKMPVAPPNDDCANATVLTVNAGTACTSSATVSFTAATASAGVPAATCALPTASAQDVWYQFTATASVHSIGLSGFTGTAQPVVMSLYQGGCSSLEQLFCSANNVIIANNLTIGQTYLVRLYFNLASPGLSTSFNICVTTPPPSSNLDCSINTINYSFETPTPLTGGNGPTFINHNTVQGWRTTANDQVMEYWPSPSYEGVSAYQGTQYIELNANANQGTMGVYQDFSTPQPTIFTVKFAHRGRMGTDTCKLLAGPPGGPYDEVYTAMTSNTAWVYHGQAPMTAITYTVPDDQPITRFYFQAVSTATGDTSVGNFLDAISFTATNIILTPNPSYMVCGELSMDISATGFGTWTAHADNPSPVTIADPTSQSTTLSNFGEPGTYYFDWGTENCISTLEVTFTGPEPDTPAVTNVTYCQGQTAEPLQAVIDEGNTQTWYFAGNMYDSPPTPSTATLGTLTYYVSQTSPNGCESIPGPITVTISTPGPSVTGFTLPAAVCTGTPNVQPTLASGFTTGGTFSSTTGLDIDAATGEIDLTTSTPGTYTVTYTYAPQAGNCLTAGSSTATIIINAAPELVEPDGLETCDDNFDGFAVFNLTTAGNQAINGQTGLTVTYHDNLDNAQTGNSPIDTPTAYLSEVANTQTVYIRAIQAGTTTNCYSVEEVVLTVHPRPAVPVIEDYILCDDPATTGNVATFDLTTKSDEATGGVTGVTVTYYNSEADAQSDTDAIDTPDDYTNTASPETIWVRLENEFGCITVSSFDLIVNPLPVINTSLEPFRECEEATGQGVFNLTNIASEVVNGASGYTVTFYATQNEADAGDVADALPASYTTISTTVYARIVNNTTQCTTTTPVELEVVAAPELIAATPLEACDGNNDGFAVFNLTPAGNEVVNGQIGLLVTYHETADDAQFGDNDLSAGQIAAYNSVSQNIYIRVVQQGTTDECASVAVVQLIVHETPEIPSLTPYILCDDNNSPDGVEIFDLTTKNG